MMALSFLALLGLLRWASATAVDLQSGVSNKVFFPIVLTWDTIAPDGFERKAIVTNGQFPAPTLKLNQGDEVEFFVQNLLPFETTVHFHGINQEGTPWSDGVPGLSQRQIKPGSSFTYRWKAAQYGSYFYHAHSRGHIEDGLYGAIYIRPDKSVERPFGKITTDAGELEAMLAAEEKTKPIILSDWRHLTSEEVWEAEEATGLDAYCSNSLLINGKGSVNCFSRETIDQWTTPAHKMVLNGTRLTDMACLPPTTAIAQGPYQHNYSAIPPGLFEGCTPSQGPTEVLKVDPAAKYASFDLISAAGISTLIFSIDEHPMYVYAVDGRYVEPVLVDAVMLANGQRYSVLVKLDQPAGDYTARSVIMGLNQINNATAIMSYTGPRSQTKPSTPYIDLIGQGTTPATRIFNSTGQIVPFPVETPAPKADQTYVLNLEHYNASYRWILGDSSFPLSLEETHPMLFQNPNDVHKQERDLTIRTKNGTWIDLIFTVTAPPVQPPHPIHKHSNKFFVIGAGNGEWNYSSVEEATEYIPQNFNLKNPPLVDTATTLPTQPGPTWLAIRYQVVNPGAFLIHCHIQVHQSGGMALAILDGVDKWPEVPLEYRVAAGIAEAMGMHKSP
ncbi:hypothetical protein VTN00DRAFT_9135 [Thermoascus crustaceus]|uniref:uncharacterized protein n=1 Tax=Thermoascus crustaceus TaxID=5088 RepID=UPI0037421535